MRNSTLILFGLLVVLLAISSADSLRSWSFRKNSPKSHFPRKEGKTKHVEGKQAEKIAKKEVELEQLEEVKNHEEIEVKKQGEEEKKKASEEASSLKDRIIENQQNKKPQTYLESIGGGKGGSQAIEQKLVKQRIQKGLKYH
ncbi:unnamed protein product [Hymenolepis diminuta]|uniref:DUF148 domain-containing protein n=1 Tax=Hymenolepis diminuta TaxID=6216 RepID=A0A0R3SHB0_HYMDI|nr:unnamed protein product [Hymenolepis diminuta]VUZ40039.1 unnamed protein product [Hymenolepis diminuta]